MIQILHAMEREFRGPERAIVFHVNLKAPGELDLLSFIYFVEKTSGATRHRVHRFWKAPNKPFAAVELRCPDAGTFERAQRLCEEKLTSSGLTVASFRDEVASTDFRGAGSQPLLRQIYATPLPEPNPQEEWQD